jgi:hypothetical protein
MLIAIFQYYDIPGSDSAKLLIMHGSGFTYPARTPAIFIDRNAGKNLAGSPLAFISLNEFAVVTKLILGGGASFAGARCGVCIVMIFQSLRYSIILLQKR